MNYANRRCYRGLCTSPPVEGNFDWDLSVAVMYKDKNCTPSAVRNFEPVYDWLRTGGSKVSINEENSFPVRSVGRLSNPYDI